MTKKLKLIGAALLALAILPAAVFLFSIPVHSLVFLGLGIAGTVTVTYQTFLVDSNGNPAPDQGYTGGTTGPTTIQSRGVNVIRALVNYADTDTLIVLTHNMQISALGLSALQPFVDWYWQALAASTNTYPVLTVALTNSNVITINKVSNVGTGGTMVVRINRAG